LFNIKENKTHPAKILALKIINVNILDMIINKERNKSED